MSYIRDAVNKFLYNLNKVAAEFTVVGDAVPRYQYDASGKHEWGDGATAVDTNLYRSAADTLKTDDNVLITGTLGVTGRITGTGGLVETATVESTAASTLANYGLSLLGSSGAVDYTMAAPIAGVRKSIGVTGASTLIKSITANGATIGGTSNNKVSIDNAGGSIHLIGLSSILWGVIGRSTFATLSTA